MNGRIAQFTYTRYVASGPARPLMGALQASLHALPESPEAKHGEHADQSDGKQEQDQLKELQVKHVRQSFRVGRSCSCGAVRLVEMHGADTAAHVLWGRCQ